MPRKHQVEEAVAIARSLLDGPVRLDSPATTLVDLARRFSVIEFDIPDVPDADGYLFQYGKVSWFSEPTFVLSVVRQLEVMGSLGEHESYAQIQFEFRYPLDEDLASTGSYSSWWFPGGKTDLDAWLATVEQAPIMNIASRKAPREFEIWQDQV
jgi:hypothetical protein